MDAPRGAVFLEYTYPYLTQGVGRASQQQRLGEPGSYDDRAVWYSTPGLHRNDPLWVGYCVQYALELPCLTSH